MLEWILSFKKPFEKCLAAASNMIFVGRITPLLDIFLSFIKFLHFYYISRQLLAMKKRFGERYDFQLYFSVGFHGKRSCCKFILKEVHNTLKNQGNWKLCCIPSHVFEVKDPSGNELSLSSSSRIFVSFRSIKYFRGNNYFYSIVLWCSGNIPITAWNSLSMTNLFKSVRNFLTPPLFL